MFTRGFQTYIAYVQLGETSRKEPINQFMFTRELIAYVGENMHEGTYQPPFTSNHLTIIPAGTCPYFEQENPLETEPDLQA